MAKPIIEEIGTKNGHPGVNTVFQVDAEDPDGGSVAFNLVNPPYGATIDAGGNFSWTPLWQHARQAFGITVRVVDDQGEEEAAVFTFNVNNQTPTLQAGPGFNPAHPGHVFQFDFSQLVQNEANDPLQYNLEDYPFGANIDQNGFFSWTPDWNQLGAKNVRVRVRDPESGQSSTRTYTINVVNAEAPTLADLPANLERHPGQLVQFQAQILNNPFQDPFEFSLVDPPYGASIDQNGNFSWTPNWSHVGPNTITVKIQEKDPTKFATKNCTIEVVNNPPAINPIANQQVNVGNNLTFDVNVGGNAGDQDTIQFSMDNPPFGATIHAVDSSTGQFSWTPQAGQAGTYMVTIRARDPRVSASRNTVQSNMSTD